MSNVLAQCHFPFAPALSQWEVSARPSAKDSFFPFFSGDSSCLRTMEPTPSISALSLLAISLVQLLHLFMFQQGTRNPFSRSLPREVVGSVENPYTYSILLHCASVTVVREERLSELKISLAAKKQSESPKKGVCLKQLHPQVPSCPTGVGGCEPALGSKVLWNSSRPPPCCGWLRGSSVLTPHFCFCVYLAESGCPLQYLGHPLLPAPSKCSQ